MTQLTTAIKDTHVATHLLLIGQTKSGKSRYVAEAAKDGYNVIYIDADNGLATLAESLKDHPEAMARVRYFSPESISVFVEQLLCLPKVVYDVKRQRAIVERDMEDSDKVIIMRGAAIPRDTILVIDSWTSMAHSAYVKCSKAMRVELSDPNLDWRPLYKASGSMLTGIAAILQACPSNVIVQAHPAQYELKVRPEGVVEAIKEKDMIVVSTTEIPISTSKPHGYTMGKYFNQIGWLEVDKAGNRHIDFQAKKGRIGGGTPNRKGKMLGDMSFARLFGAPKNTEPDSSWLEEMTLAEFKERRKGGSQLKTGRLK